MIHKRRFNKFVPFIAILTLVIGLSLILIYQKGLGQISIKEGDVAPSTLKSPKTVYYRSNLKTKELQDQASAQVDKIFRVDDKALDRQKEKIDKTIEDINFIRSRSNESTEAKIASLKNVSNLNLSDEILGYIINFDEGSWANVTKNTSDILFDFQRNEKLKFDELENYKNKVPLKVNTSLSDPEKKTVIVLAQNLIIPNTFLDEVETQKKIDEAKSQISPVYYTIETDQVIVKGGDKISAYDKEKLEAVGITSTQFNWQNIISKFLFVFILVTLSALFIYILIPEKGISYNKAFLLFGLLLIILAFLARVLLPFKPVVAYIFPVAAFSIIMSILVDFKVGLFSTIAFSFIFGLVGIGSFELMVVQLFSSLGGLLGIRKIQRLSSLFKSFIFIFLANFLTAFAFNLAAGNSNLRTIGILLVSALASAVLSIIIVAGSIVFLGNFFGLTSFLQLLELENPSHPVLRELSVKAPGTYHHSIFVSNLAEKAAKAVGADPLLCRVGAYYHDVGKMYNPLYFIENQEGMINIHKKLAPQQSAEYIINHVSQGVQIAEKFHLPTRIIDFIKEHHGVTHVQYFYELAKTEKNLDAKKYQYQGPKPQSKETAIVMLADSAEASVRAIESATPENIEEKVYEVCNDRLTQGELDECPLTFEDLSKIKEVFVETLTAIFHQRIDYPEAEG